MSEAFKTYTILKATDLQEGRYYKYPLSEKGKFLYSGKLTWKRIKPLGELSVLVFEERYSETKEESYKSCSDGHYVELGLFEKISMWFKGEL